MTLVELLIVMAIMTLLLAASLRLAQPAFQGRKAREAARQLNAVFAGAKARATERGRPFGVWFERTPGNLNQCLEVFQAEIPPPYVGDLQDARVSFRFDDNNTPMNPLDDFWRVVFGSGQCGTLIAQNGALVSVGDTFWMKFDFRGRVYNVTRRSPDPPASPSAMIFEDDFQLAGSPPPTPPYGLRFQIFLPPRKSLATPLDLPNGTAIDLSLSGLGATGTDFDVWNLPPAFPDPRPVIVLFSPSGSVELVYSRGIAFAPVSEVHFLIGRNETIAALDSGSPVGPPNPRDTRNLQDQDNLWVTVGHRSGAVTSAENYFSALTPTIDVSRQFARSAQAKGGG